MRKHIWVLAVLGLFTCSSASAQIFKREGGEKDQDNKEKRKFYQSSNGLLIGYERGQHDFLQIGYQYNWKKLRLVKPVIHAVDGFMEYNLGTNTLGAKAVYWQRHGRLKLTYGAHAGYFTDFTENSFSLGPTVGFRIIGFHGQLGYNFLTNPAVEDANRMYLSLNFFIPYHTKLFSKKGDKTKTIFQW